MAEQTLKDLLHHAMKDIYFAEKAILTALPKIIKAAHSGDLKEALEKHRQETENHIKRLEQGFGELGEKPETTPCEAIKGILKEGDEIIEKFGGSSVGDAGIAFACQAVEHYEINRYGSMHVWAKELGMDELADLFHATLEEEYAADDGLTALAEAALNMDDEKATAPKKRVAGR